MDSPPPIVDPKVVDWLERAFPNCVPSLNLSDREVWFKAGQVSVVSHLRELVKRQSENILTNVQLTKNAGS
jgi:hypothetical protein